MKKRTQVFTCALVYPNPGPAVLGMVIREKAKNRKIICAPKDPKMSNQRAILLSTIRGLKKVKHRHKPVDVFCTSEYVVKGVNQKRYHDKVLGRQGLFGTKLPKHNNLDLWGKLLPLNQSFEDIRFLQIKAGLDPDCKEDVKAGWEKFSNANGTRITKKEFRKLVRRLNLAYQIAAEKFSE